MRTHVKVGVSPYGETVTVEGDDEFKNSWNVTTYHPDRTPHHHIVAGNQPSKDAAMEFANAAVANGHMAA